jgi:hypothetical protein
MWNVFAYLGLLLATCGYALARGGAPERIGAAIVFGAVVLSMAALGRPLGHFASRETGVLIVDITMLLAVVTLALKAERYWPMWMAAFLGLGLELQFVMWVDPNGHREIYKVLHFWDAYPTLLILALGTARHRLRVARDGADASWSDFSRRCPSPLRTTSPQR